MKLLSICMSPSSVASALLFEIFFSAPCYQFPSVCAFHLGRKVKLHIHTKQKKHIVSYWRVYPSDLYIYLTPKWCRSQLRLACSERFKIGHAVFSIQNWQRRNRSTICCCPTTPCFVGRPTSTERLTAFKTLSASGGSEGTTSHVRTACLPKPLKHTEVSTVKSEFNKFKITELCLTPTQYSVPSV